MATKECFKGITWDGTPTGKVCVVDAHLLPLFIGS
jgi:hypothetical protein